MIFIYLLTWGTTLFCLYAITQHIWWRHLDHLLWQMTTEWPGLDSPHYVSRLYRDISLIILSHRVHNPVIYYPFVYKGRYVQIITSEYSHRRWHDDVPGLREQLIILN